MTIKLTVDNRQGVLDQITGIIRRHGWNIRTMNVEEIAADCSEIRIRIEDRGADADKLGKALSRLDCVRHWEEYADTSENERNKR